MDYERVLKQLCALPGPSGFEGPVARTTAELLRPLVDEVSVTPMGCVVGVRRCGREGAPKLMLDAHLDEIGLIVTGHEDGFLRFAPLGGVDSRMLPDREVTVLSDPPVLGVVACLPPHIQTSEDMERSIPIKELYIDVGLSQEGARRRIPIGTPVVYRTGCMPLGEKLLCGKALDDRVGFTALLNVAECLKDQELDVDLYIVGSVREETHLTGAATTAYGIVPDLCVAVDVTHANSPDVSKEKTYQMSGGPIIGVGPNCTRWMQKRMEAKARELEMDYQLEVMAGNTHTNAWPVQISREGVASAILSLPMRYMHTPAEVMSRTDFEDTVRLLAAFIQGIGEEVSGRV